MKLESSVSMPSELLEAESQRVQAYQIHGVSLVVRSNRHLLLELLDEQFGRFRCAHQMTESLLQISFYTLPVAWRPEIAVSQKIDLRTVTYAALSQPQFTPVLYYSGEQMFLVTDLLQGYGVGSIAASASDEELRLIY